MAECGICLDVLRNPVSVPCGHVHCEKCLQTYIISGADSLKSTCPTCRKSFYTAAFDLKFVPQKYHNFILPCVRKIYMDIPSVAALQGDITLLTQHLEAYTEQNEQLRRCCKNYKHRLREVESERNTTLANVQEAQDKVDVLREKYIRLKKKYEEARLRDDPCSTTKNPDSPRRKRALPKSRLSDSMHHEDENMSRTVKRQRTHRYSGVGSTTRSLEEDE